MKRNTVLILFLTAIFSLPGLLPAQESLSGVVYYKQMDKIEFEPTGRPEFDQFAQTMPTEYTFEKMLYFDAGQSLFEDSPNPAGEPMDRRERWFYHMSKYGRKPRPTLQKIYNDFENREKTEVLEFMTREFRVNASFDTLNWKITGEFRTILDYTCMGAETMDGEDPVTAYFTPQIPVSAGPDKFYGLPGLILAVERNGYTTYLASRIEMKPVGEWLVEPDDGKKVTRAELDQIVEEKVEEFRKERMGGGPHGRGRH
jgi:GLPGLI family protein